MGQCWGDSAKPDDGAKKERDGIYRDMWRDMENARTDREEEGAPDIPANINLLVLSDVFSESELGGAQARTSLLRIRDGNGTSEDYLIVPGAVLAYSQNRVLPDEVKQYLITVYKMLIFYNVEVDQEEE